MSHRQKDWDEAAREKQGAGCRDKVKQTERSDQLFVTRTTKHEESECCQEAEEK